MEENGQGQNDGRSTTTSQGTGSVEVAGLVIDVEQETKSETQNENMTTFQEDQFQRILQISGQRKHYTHSARGGSPSLLNHLTTSHPSVLQTDAAADSNDNLASLTKYYTKVLKPITPKVEAVTKEGFKKHLLSFIVKTDQPFSVVENEAFIGMMKYYTFQNPNTQLPSQTTVRNWISETYAEEKAKLLHSLTTNDGQISFILDGWSSSNMKSFQGAIACWINKDWKLCNSTLNLTILTGEHTGANLCSAFETVLEDFKLWPKLLAITTDNASNMTTMLKKLDEAAIRNLSDFSSSEYRVRCLAHVINLACKVIVSNVVGSCTSSLNDEESDETSESESEEIPHGSLKEATKLISQGHSPTLSDTETVYQYLFASLESYTEHNELKLLSLRSRTRTVEEEWIRKAVSSAWDKLKKYYDSSESLVYVVATAMDPRFKLHWFEVAWEKEYVDRAKSKLTNLWKSKYKHAISDPHKTNDTTLAPNPETASSQECGIANVMAKRMEKFHKQDDELKCFLKEPVILPSQISNGISGVLKWWKMRESDYPALSRMAKDFLAVSATGVPVERLFSNGPDLLTSRRQRLNADTIRQCMCLKQWLKASGGAYQVDGFRDALQTKLGFDESYNE
ncbi:Zinc finger BED domain-containing protein RICESLEEPER 3 [Orchesella cincta]|uniref:Zinc finger BED domain-containing protein RICESLEEPER 3 n=1 Tax=Orchesella cincta TaxID=48709 RepID=A0A1D2M915_ORCCI|nr:Zinc finger BED domain-containing protein RICESLEEPER 3 [Orchesella cincta]